MNTTHDREQYAQEARQWIRKIFRLHDSAELPKETEHNFLPRLLRTDIEVTDAELLVYQYTLDDFFAKVKGAKRPSILAACRHTDKHPQPCLCPLMWFAQHARTERECEASAALATLSTLAVTDAET